jgi:cell wall-associated NlpC family hydrolase
MTNRNAIFILVISCLLGMVSCKTALTDKTEYENGWELETQPRQSNKNKGKNDKTAANTKPANHTTPKPTVDPKSNNSSITSASLKKEIEQWLGVPYKYGGTTKQGVDCSGFCGNVFKNVYNLSLGRSAQDIYDQSKPINRNTIKEGDLVFFKINSSRVSHVGIYLSQNRFVHASTSRGVIISNLDEAYWTKYYYASGRVSQ